MRTLQKWKESWESLPRTWFLQESWGIHTQSLLLYENSKNSPYSLSKFVKISVLKWLNGILYNSCSNWARLVSRCIRHGKLKFLHQWVSATSALRSFCRPNSPREYIFRHGELWTFALWTSSPSTRHYEISRRCELGASGLWCSLPQVALGSPWRVNLCTFSLFFFLAWCLDIQFLHKWIK